MVFNGASYAWQIKGRIYPAKRWAFNTFHFTVLFACRRARWKLGEEKAGILQKAITHSGLSLCLASWGALINPRPLGFSDHPLHLRQQREHNNEYPIWHFGAFPLLPIRHPHGFYQITSPLKREIAPSSNFIYSHVNKSLFSPHCLVYECLSVIVIFMMNTYRQRISLLKNAP